MILTPFQQNVCRFMMPIYFQQTPCKLMIQDFFEKGFSTDTSVIVGAKGL
jgi:hypothetical protein